MLHCIEAALRETVVQQHKSNFFLLDNTNTCDVELFKIIRQNIKRKHKKNILFTFLAYSIEPLHITNVSSA